MARENILKNQYPSSMYMPLPKDQMLKAVSGTFDGFKYFFENCMLIQDRDTRQYIKPKMNRGQEMMAKTIFSYIDPNTRANEHKECVIAGPRQWGKSTGLTAISNYMEAYVPDMENLNLVHTMHVADAATKYFKQKMEPILTYVHPDIFPKIIKDSSVSSTLLKYEDILGIKRGGFYEILSAGSNSVRSGTVSVWLADEPAEYRNPEMTEDAVSGAISSYGFSFTAYIGTFSDRISDYFLNKIKTAIAHPDEMELVFVPWFLVYGRKGDERGVDMNNLNEYENTVILPEMDKYQVPREEWAQHIGWYRRRALRTSKMRYEFPTSIEDIISLTSNKCVFADNLISRQRKHVMAGKMYRLVTDNVTKNVEAQETDDSPFIIYKKPQYGHRYRLMVDPIVSASDDSDNFSMMIFDDDTLEQMAVFRGKDYPLEDYADFAVSIAKIYNGALIIPESNVAQAFTVSVRGLRYYNLYYETPKNRKDGIAGIRTTATSKANWIDKLILLLENDRIILHDKNTIDEMTWFEKKVKNHSNGSTTIKMEAKKGKHDDDISCLFLLAGSLNASQLSGKKKSGFDVIF